MNITQNDTYTKLSLILENILGNFQTFHNPEQLQGD